MPWYRPTNEKFTSAESQSYQDILTNAPIGFYISTPEGRLLFANPALARMHGYDSPAEFMESVTDIPRQVYVNSNDRQEYIRILEEQGEVFDYECLFRRCDGSEFWGSMSGRIVRDEDGRADHYQGFIIEVTDRRQSEAALKDKDEELARYFSLSLDLLCIADVEGRFVRLNPEWEKILGYSAAELEGQSFWEFIHPDDIKPTQEAVSTLKDQKEVLNFENRYRCKDGTYRWLEWRSKPCGSLIYAVARDMSERILAQEKLAEKEQFLQAVFDSIQDGISVLDPDLNIIRVNRIMKQWYSHMRPLEGKKCYLAYHGRKKECEICPSIRALKTGRLEADEVSLVQEDGKTGTLELFAFPMINDAGKPTGVVEYVRDITKRKQAEEAQRASEERYRSIIRVSNTGAWEYHQKDDYLWCSPEYFEMLGLDPASYPLQDRSSLKQAWKDLIHPEDLEKAAKVFADYLARGSQGLYENYFRMQHVDGHWVWIWSRGQTLRNTDGTLTDVTVGTHIDISERKRAEEKSKKLHDQLAHAHKMESVGILAGGVAHDFNNLLHAMGGNLELLDAAMPDDHPGKKRIRTIQKSIDRGSQLVSQMLLFSRKAEARKQRLDLNQEIENTLKLLERTIPRMIRIQFNPGNDIRPIFADPVQVEQVMYNLGTNAADAMPEGGSLVLETSNAVMDQDMERASSGKETGEYVLMSVSDTGIGMNRNIINKVFDPFFTTKEVGKGTGLGLASVYGIVKAHKGFINCYSEPGKGTVFKVYWPAYTESHDEISADPEELHSSEGTETILIVDDEEDIIELTSNVLQSHGYRVVSASTGEDGLKHYFDMKDSIDAVLLDLNMPGMGGLKCLENILRIDSKARVIISSGYSVNGQARDVQGSGAAGFIEKPYRIHDLLVKLRSILDG